jgi:hypothetical protein
VTPTPDLRPDSQGLNRAPARNPGLRGSILRPDDDDCFVLKPKRYALRQIQRVLKRAISPSGRLDPDALVRAGSGSGKRP